MKTESRFKLLSFTFTPDEVRRYQPRNMRKELDVGLKEYPLAIISAIRERNKMPLSLQVLIESQ